MVHRLTLTNLSILANFGNLGAQYPEDESSVNLVEIRSPSDENLPHFGPTRPTMTQIKCQRLERCRNPVLSLTQFFSFPLIENADHLLLGGSPKIKGQHNLNAVSTENETSSVSFSFGENVEITRESCCAVCPVPPSLE
eukprot:GFUD01003819.1.p1 GENE.GFUD01003819.1~~GFUD01003819.1.p1  ORF type:complete len:139 (-),score=7.75 GFUD01003819.1:1448-1864(-)